MTKPYAPREAPTGPTHEAFQSLIPGATMIYWTGHNLSHLCQDGIADEKITQGAEKVVGYSEILKAREMRDWASGLEQEGLGFLTQKKNGTKYDYRITRAKE